MSKRTTDAQKSATAKAPAPVDKIDPELAAEFHAAGARVNETAEIAKQAMAQHHDARAVFGYVSDRIRAKYRLAPADAINPDGTIVRAPADSKVPA